MKVVSGLKDVLAFWRPRKPSVPFAVLFKKFKGVLERNNAILELMADMGDKLGGEYIFDRQYILSTCERLGDMVFKLVSDLSVLGQRKNVELFLAFERVQHDIQEELAGRHSFSSPRLAIPLSELGRDMNEKAGNKLASLGDVRNVLGLRTPDGFAITTKAFFDFMELCGLRALVEERLAGWDGEDEAYFGRMSREVRDRILEATVPRPVASCVSAMLDVLAAGRGRQNLRLAVRSSAWGEDGESSFAGQYESFLNVPPDQVLDAYKQVVASAYAPEAWRYRLRRGFREHEMAMAVGCQVMVDAEVSGGLYTYAPLSRDEEAMVISAAWGLGPPVVGGTAATDTFVLSRDAPHGIRSADADNKETMLVASPDGGTMTAEVPVERRNVLSLTPERLDGLIEAAVALERYYKRPQDVEWAFDKAGTLYILQARPMSIRSRVTEAVPCVESATRDAEVIFSGKGTVVQRGVVTGRVYLARRNDDLSGFPHGAILVSHHTSPRFSRIMGKAQGIITDVGSAVGHMATIAREHRVPTVVNTGIATSLLKNGDEITFDATEKVVYRGTVRELCRFELAQEEVFEESYEYRLLRRLLQRISPLNLIDPHSEDFKPSSCRTFHDITRYAHEKAVEALIALSENHQGDHDTPPRRLLTEIPLGLMVIDVEGGLSCNPAAGEVPEADVRSTPLKALLAGLSESGMWATEPVSVDLGSFMSSFTRTFSSSMASPKQIGKNLAVVSREYMNLNLRLGYHFNIIDAFISGTLNDNYIYFRFLGGVTDLIRRSRRARFIADVLERNDFRVEVHGDLVVGRVKKLPAESMMEKMKVLGGLIGYTRQLDVRMRSDDELALHIEEFMHRIEPMLGGTH